MLTAQESELHLLDNPYDFRLVLGEQRKVNLFFNDKEFQSDLAVGTLAYISQLPELEKLYLIETSENCLWTVYDYVNNLFRVNGNHDHDEQYFVEEPWITSREPAKISETIIHNTYTKFPSQWKSLDDAEKIIYGALVYLRFIGEAEPNFGIEKVTEFIEKENLDHNLLVAYISIITSLVKSRIESSSVYSDFSISLINRFLPPKPDVKHLLKRYLMYIRYSVGSYSRIKLNDKVNVKNVFGYRYERVREIVSRANIPGIHTPQELILVAEKNSGLAVPELILKSPESIIEHLAEKLKAYGQKDISQFYNDDLFYNFFGIQKQAIEWQMFTKKWELRFIDMLMQARNIAFSSKQLIYKDYLLCESMNECIAMLANNIILQKGSYKSPSTHNPHMFKKIFGVHPGYLWSIITSNGWKTSAAQLRNKAEIRAGVRIAQIDHFKSKTSTINFMANKIRLFGTDYHRPRVTQNEEFIKIFGINPHTLNGRIEYRNWGISLRGLILKAEEKAGIEKTIKTGVRLESYETALKYFIKIIRKKKNDFNPSKWSHARVFYEFFNVHYSTLAKKIKRNNWPVQSVGEFIRLAENKVFPK